MHMNLITKEQYTELSTDLKESSTVSDLMNGFPPICKEDPLEVRVNFILDHYEKTGKTIKLSDIPDTMYGGALPVAKRRKSKKRTITEAEDIEEDPESLPKRAKKEKRDSQKQDIGPAVPCI
jgi:hypothetical protein